MMRPILTITVAMLTAVFATAGDVEFSLDLDSFKWTPQQDPQTRARKAQWEDPMGRMMHHFNQNQNWIMRGTMPGADRVNGVAVRAKAQNGLPLHLIASTMQGGFDIDQRDLVRLGRRRGNDHELDLQFLEQQLTEELGRKLAPQ